MKCMNCGKILKGHANGEKDFRQLTRRQQQATIANATRLLKAYRSIYAASLAILPSDGATPINSSKVE